jgi:hypothetical protein
MKSWLQNKPPSRRATGLNAPRQEKDKPGPNVREDAEGSRWEEQAERLRREYELEQQERELARQELHRREQDALHKINNENNELRQRIDGLASRSDKEVQDLRQENEKLQDRLSAEVEEIRKEHDKTLLELQNQHDTTLSQLNDTHARTISDLKEQNERELARLRDTNNYLRNYYDTEIRTLKAKTTSATKTETTAVENERDQLRKRVKAMKASFLIQNGDVENFEKLIDMQEQLTDAQSARETIQKEMEQLKADKDAIQKELEELKSRTGGMLQEGRTKTETLRQEDKETIQRLRTQLLRDLKSQADSMDNRKDDIDHILGNLSREVESFRSTVSVGMLKERADLAAKIQELEEGHGSPALAARAYDVDDGYHPPIGDVVPEAVNVGIAPKTKATVSASA